MTKREIAATMTAALTVALVGGFLTEIGPWYHALQQPSWKPPDWAFGPIWAVILIMWGISWGLMWRGAPDLATRVKASTFFVFSGILNIAWSALFFTFKRPDWALVEAGLLWLSIAILIVVGWRIDRRASALLVPYIIWVSTAFVLNWRVVELNQPF